MPMISIRCRLRSSAEPAARSRAASTCAIRSTRRLRTCCSRCCAAPGFSRIGSATAPAKSRRSEAMKAWIGLALLACAGPTLAAPGDLSLVELAEGGQTQPALALIDHGADVNAPSDD